MIMYLKTMYNCLLLNNKLKGKTTPNFIMRHHAEYYRVHLCLNLYFLHTDFSHLSYFQK